MRELTLLVLSIYLVSCGTSVQNTDSGSHVTAGEADMGVNEGQDEAKLDIQGHRGARGLKPENTLPGFEVALDVGVTTLELDMHYTSDNVVVVWHDDRIKKEKCRLIGSAENAPDPEETTDLSELLISNLSLQQIKAYQCDLNPDPSLFPEQNNEPTPLAANNYAIPTLDELFDFVIEYSNSEIKSASQQSSARVVNFNIETKRRPSKPEVINDGFDGVNPGPFELDVLHSIAEFGLQKRVSIQSFDHRSLWSIASVDPSITLVALTYSEIPDLHELSTQGASVWSPNYQVLDKTSVDLAHEAGLKVIPWTINERPIMDEILSFGVDGIITDRPDIIASH